MSRGEDSPSHCIARPSYLPQRFFVETQYFVFLLDLIAKQG